MGKSTKIPAQVPSYIIDLGVPPPVGTKNYLTAYKGWVYACVTAIASHVSGIELKLYSRKKVRGEDEIEEVKDHEELSILRHINNFMTFNQITEVTETYNQLAGEAYWAKLRGPTGKVVELWPLRPDWVSVLPSSSDYIRGYVYKPDGMAKGVEFDRKDIVPFKDLDPKNAYRGQGIVKAVAMAIDIDEFASDWVRTFFYNSALPGLVFTTDKKLRDVEIERFLKQWNTKFRGRRNSHKIAFLGGGLKPEPITKSPSEMSFLSMKKDMRDEILAGFKVPKSVLGLTEDVNRANAEATVRQFIEGTVKPRMIKLATHLNEFFLTEWPDEDLFFDFTDPVPSDRELDLKIYDNALKNGWMTINEVRDLEKLIPVQGGDKIYLPFSLQPLGKVGDKINNFFKGKKGEAEQGVVVLSAKKTASRIKFTMPVPARRLSQLREEALAKNISHNLKKLISNMLVEERTVKEKALNTEKKEMFWKNMIAKTDVLEGEMQQMVLKLFEEQRSEVINNVEMVKYYRKEYRKGKEAMFLFKLEDAEIIWMSVFEPFIKNVIREKGTEVFDFLGLRQSLTFNEKSLKWIQTEGLKFVTGVNETTREDLKVAIGEGLQSEESIDQLKGRILGVFESATKSRAEMIARTEVLRATNFATNEAYKQSGIVKSKEWLTALDERTCEICTPLDTKIVGVNESFNTSVGAVDFPPVHPRCRCTIIPVISDKAMSSEDRKARSIANKMEEAQSKEGVKDAKKEANKIIEESKKVLSDTKDETDRLLSDARKVAQEESSKLLEKTREEVAESKEEAKSFVENLKEKALKLFGK